MDIIPIAVEQPSVYDVIVEDDGYNVDISDDKNVAVNIDVAILHPYESDYEGVYTVTPKVHTETVLPTTGKTLSDDVTVLEIPYYETTGEHGTTIYIADEV